MTFNNMPSLSEEIALLKSGILKEKVKFVPTRAIWRSPVH